MRRAFWFQLIAISIFFTLLSGIISVLIFQSVSAKALQETRRNAYLFLANILESAPFDQSLPQYERFRADSGNIGRSIWILSESGHVLASNTKEAPPPSWELIPKPLARHEISAQIPQFRNFADLVLVRLNKPDPTYLLVRPEKDTPNRAIAGAEITIFLVSIFITTLSGLAMIFAYLRRTSREAKQVILQLHGGNLSARFDIHRIDRIGSLKLDFNAMADEIERLVARIQITENTRRDLLQELSHDLRTPLTSLKTSIETLVQFRGKMTVTQQQEMLSVAQTELIYFTHLLDDLFFIADLAEPTYRKTQETVDLVEMCEMEIQARISSSSNLQWQWVDKTDNTAFVEGDRHLLLRMLRNCLDNASKFASTMVAVTLINEKGVVSLSIEDDGPGIESEALKFFGTRRKSRIQSSTSNISLGLGSVIITAIAQLHGATVSISNRRTKLDGATGTILTFAFAK